MKTLRQLLEVDSLRKQAVEVVKKYSKPNPTIVEIGSSRRYTTEAYGLEGLLTLHLLNLCDELECEMWSVDIDPYTSWALKQIFTGHSAHSSNMDGETFLKGFNRPIDILNLDSMDVGIEGYKEHHARLYNNARDKLADDSLLILDDVFPLDGCGKAELVIPMAIEDGFKYVCQGYCCVLRRTR